MTADELRAAWPTVTFGHLNVPRGSIGWQVCPACALSAALDLLAEAQRDRKAIAELLKDVWGSGPRAARASEEK